MIRKYVFLSRSLVLFSITAVVAITAVNNPAVADETPPPETELTWPEGATVTGRVLDHTGAPVAKAEVLLLGEERIIVDADRRNWFVREKDKPRPSSARTDESGMFTVTRTEGTANRLAVIAEDPLFWVVPRKQLGQADRLEIKLPAAGSLAVQCNHPSKPAKIPLTMELKSFDRVTWNQDLLRFHDGTFSLKNPGETLFEHLPPGQYAVQRREVTRTGDSNLSTGADRQLVQIESEKRADLTFERKAGRPLSGVVRGFENVELKYARLSIFYLGPEEILGTDGKSSRHSVAFDVILIGSDGRFTTDPIPPGDYDAYLFAVRASTPDLSSQSADFSGHVRFTIPENGEPPHVELVAKANPPPDLSQVPDLRVHVVDEEGNPVLKPEAVIQRADHIRGQWTAGRDGFVFLGDPKEHRNTALEILVRADGYASTIAHFSSHELEKLSKGEATIPLLRGEKIQLRFNLPAGLTWPKDLLPEVYFDEMRGQVGMMRQPSNRGRGAAPDYNMLNLKEAGEGRFEFQLAGTTPRFYVAVHAPGFLQHFETGPFTYADVKNGIVEIDLPQPAALDISFTPGDHAAANSPFKSTALEVLRQTEGDSYRRVASTASSSQTQQIKLTDLAPGQYMATVRTQPQDDQQPLPGTEINLGKYFDRRTVILKEGQTERIDFRSVPYDSNAFRGTRTAVVQIRTPDGKPATDRMATVVRHDGHYGNQTVFSGAVPESGEIVLKEITDLIPDSLKQISSYRVSIDNHSLGSFRFHTPESIEEFEFLLTPSVGDLAPDVRFTNLASGQELLLSTFRGQVVMVEFWATWCGPCQQPMAKLNALANEQKATWKDQVAIVPISIDSDPSRVQSHVQPREWTGLDHFWTGGESGTGFESPAARAFVIHGVPEAILIGRDGRILWRGHPLPRQSDDEGMKSQIENALK